MMKTYKFDLITVVMRGGSSMLVLILVSIFSASILQNESVLNNTPALLSVLLLIGALCLLPIYTLIRLIRSKLVIDDQKISNTGAFFKHELYFDDIRGYRQAGLHIRIEPIDRSKKPIKVSFNMAGKDELLAWLAEYYPDLDKLNEAEEEEEFLLSEANGRTVEERVHKLEQARRNTIILNWAGGILAAWTLFWTEPYQYCIMACIVFPIFCIIIMRFSGGLFRFHLRANSAYPTLAPGIFLPSVALGLRGGYDFEMLDMFTLWLPLGLIAGAFTILLLLGNKGLGYKDLKSIVTLIVLALSIWAYSYGLLVSLNCHYDNSEIQIHRAAVISKHISGRKVKSHYLELSPWVQSPNTEIQVSKSLYTKLNPGDTLHIHIKKGDLGVPWYWIAEK